MCRRTVFGTSADVEDLKAAQGELHDVRAALAHATRVMTMGELTASIVHEINQPLAGAFSHLHQVIDRYLRLMDQSDYSDFH